MRCFAIVLALTVAAAAAAATDPLEGSHQCLIVVTDSWKSTNGTMSIFERESDSKWRRRRSTIPVVVGRAGLGRGRGIIKTTSLPGPLKKEGDDKAPAGVFRLPYAFGKAPQVPTKMPYLTVSRSVIAVDDPRSRFYNQLVDQDKIEKRDWRHAEKLFGVDVYKLGIFIEHNIPPRPDAGSCIFLHIWKNPATATSGCTAMSERNLLDVIRWLDPARKALLVQLPRPVYDHLRVTWNLPPLP